MEPVDSSVSHQSSLPSEGASPQEQIVGQSSGSQWDVGRFVQTLAFFDVFPLFRGLRRLWPGGIPQSTCIDSGNCRDHSTILVVGGTGGIGQRVVKRLLAQGYPVRALVRDGERARKVLGATVALFEADLTLPETLTPALMTNVRAVICCTGGQIGPVEGDPPTREKYYQGIQFYLPKVVDSPEQVDYLGIQTLVRVMEQGGVTAAPSPGKQTLFDFTQPSAQSARIWVAVDDVVMGGVSRSGLRLGGDRAIFSGEVSTTNSGGFASVRTKNVTPPWDLSRYSGFELRLKGDGQRYKFIARCEEKWDGLSYCYSFDTLKEQWMTLQVPFLELIPVFRAKTVPNADRFDASQVFALQLMLSKFEYDRALNPAFSPGAFALEVSGIWAYGGKSTPQWVTISSAGVTRPGKPGLDLEAEPPAVRMNEQLGGILTWKLRGEEVVRQSSLVHTIIRPCALTEQSGDQALEFDQGDTWKGQVSRDAIADLCVQAIQLPEAANKTFEVRATQKSANQQDWPQLLSNLTVD